jgi:hypothetical protein
MRFVELSKTYRRKSQAGRQASYALVQTVHRFQAVASDVSEKFTWRGRTVPPKLIAFLQAALMAGDIRYPSYDDNPSKFRKLLRKAPTRPAPAKLFL